MFRLPFSTPTHSDSGSEPALSHTKITHDRDEPVGLRASGNLPPPPVSKAKQCKTEAAAVHWPCGGIAVRRRRGERQQRSHVFAWLQNFAEAVSARNHRGPDRINTPQGKQAHASMMRQTAPWTDRIMFRPTLACMAPVLPPRHWIQATSALKGRSIRVLHWNHT